MTSAIMAFLHHLAAFALTAAIICMNITFRKDLSLADARRIQMMDIIYGVSRGVVVIVGILRVFYFEKGAPFYAQNWFFWTKMLALPWPRCSRSTRRSALSRGTSSSQKTRL
jgi:putative membrane protein